MTRSRKSAAHDPGETAGEPAAPESSDAQDAQDDEPVAPSQGEPSFAIVGVGASAGGLKALEAFLRHVPAQCGMAFVVVQHLDPTRKGMLPELLQRATSMSVVQIKDRTRVEPNRVYVIPPNRDLSILHGVLHLLDPVDARGLRLPIDFFFRSLAVDQKAKSVGVILSGMGSDGTLGLRAIKEQAGVVFVQAPETAKYDSMPQAAIDAGLADVVAPAEELAEKLVAYQAHSTHLSRGGDVAAAPKTQSAIEKICVLLRNSTGHDFSLYKRSTVHRRIQRRMGLHQIESIALYVKYLQENSQEGLLLFKEMLIGVTSFFRDPEAWQHLEEDVLPALLTEHSSRGVIRAWVAGCSTGEEAYSLAIVLKETLAKLDLDRHVTLQIFATDLDKDAIDRARLGVYPLNIAGDVPAERLARHFIKEECQYRVSPAIREAVVFAEQNLIMDPPFTRLDVLTCRNLLIYLAPELQRKLLPLFHYSLAPGGVLFLGSAETTAAASDLFTPLGKKARTYRRIERPKRASSLEFPTSFHSRPPTGDNEQPSAAPALNLQALADQLLLRRYSPAAVLTNDSGDILYVGGRTGEYLEPAAGNANWNIHAMAREGLRFELTNAFQSAVREQHIVARSGIRLDGGTTGHAVDFTVEPLQEPEALRRMVLIVFTEPAGAPDAEPRRSILRRAPKKAEKELTRALQELSSTREEMQTSQEELRSTNEELQSTNEELQSTNEELTTSKEEMQSLNEELQTVNHELQTKLDDLSRATDDMRNLLDSTEIATLFLDAQLRVRRFTPQTTKLFRLLPGDVSRPITDLATDLVYPALAADAANVLSSLFFVESEVETTDGRWYKARMMPYRTVDNRIDGVVITFSDITAAKTLEAALREKSGE